MASAEPVPDVVEPLKRCGSNELLRPDSADVRPLHRSGSFEFLPPVFSELRVVLLGNSWTERRAVGNLILAENQLITEKEPDQCEKFSSEFEDKSVTIINTPDLLRTDLSEDDLSDQVESCVSLSDPGPHVFLLVLQPESFTEEQKWKLCRFLTRLSDRSFDHSMLLISTPREERDDDSPDLLLKEMVVKCQYRHLQLKNLKHPELLTRLGQIVKENNGYLSCAQNITEVDVRKEEVRTIFTPTTDKDGFRIVMFGKNEDKKKSLCNTILNKKNRFSKLNPSKHSEVACGEWREKPVKIVKVPDIFSLSVEALMEEMQSCVTLCLPGPNVLLLLVKPSDFTEKNRKTLQLVLNWFHQDPFKHTIVVLTHFEERKPAVKNLLEECGGRHYNMFKEDHKVLMQKIQNIVDRNRETFLTFSEDSSKSQPKEMKTHLNLVLFGPSEPLKTAAAKVILGHKDLPSECVRKQGEVFGRGVSLVELPALYGKAEQEVMEESFRCVSLCDPEGVHAFILVLPVGPLTDEDKGELHTIQDTFSSRVNNFTIILFTTELNPKHPAVDKFVKENRDIQDLLQICGGRYFVLNIRDRRQIKDLMETLQKNVSDREKDSSYTTKTLLWGQMEEKLQLQNKLKKFESKTVATDPQQIPAADCLRIVLIGKTGGGKSSSGNTILGRKQFEAKASQQSVTRNCQKAQTVIAGRRVVVVDTPGLFDNTLTADQVDEELLKCISLLAPGPHVFLLVLQVGRFTEEEKQTLRQMKKVFGKNSEDFTLILFTGGDKLQYEEKTIEQYIREGRDESFRKLVNDCGGRCHVFNNYDTKNRSQTNELIQKINNMVKKNEGKCFTSEMLQEAEAAIQREVKRILEEKEEEIQKLKEELQKKHQEEKETLRRKMEEHREEMEKERKQRDEQFKEMEENNRKEREQKKREQREREEEEKKRKEEEERQQQQWGKERQDLEKKIKQESEEKETIDRKLEEMRKQMEEKRDAWEKERKEWWEKRHREDEERREELKRFQEKYEKEREKYENQRREDEKRRREQEEERKELEKKYQNQLEEVKRKFEDEARKHAEEFNEFKEKYKKDFYALLQKHGEKREK